VGQVTFYASQSHIWAMYVYFGSLSAEEECVPD